MLVKLVLMFENKYHTKLHCLYRKFHLYFLLIDAPTALRCMAQQLYPRPGEE